MPSASTLWLPDLSPLWKATLFGGRPLRGGGRFFFSGQVERGALQGVAAMPYFRATMIDQVILMSGDEPGQGDGLDEIETGVVTRTRPRTKKPSNYKVLMLNDDYTPMEFVVLVLQRYFSMDLEDATRVMLQVHQQGVAVCGVFTYEVAETKVSQVIDFARENQHPLQCTLEKA
jgi:ATP-dependent Clp protease adaptor protein ClpS